MTLKYPLSRNHCFGRRWTLALCLFFGLSAAAFGQANQPPVVNAGPDQTINFPDSATLNGSASDDGLPNPPGALTYTWSVVTGPGTVSFADASATNTTASFSVGGVYTLRLTADDGAASSSDDVVITVNQAPVVNAGRTSHCQTLPT